MTSRSEGRLYERCDVCGAPETDPLSIPYPCGSYCFCRGCGYDFSGEELAEAENLIRLMGQIPADVFGTDPRKLIVRMIRLARAGVPSGRAKQESHAA